MQDKDSLKQLFRSIFKDWSEEQIDKYAEKISAKYATIKSGDNVIHLEYYDFFIGDADIRYIENLLSKVGLELSRFDKSEIPYASIEQFTLQLSISLSNPVVTAILLGLGTNALWDSIKQASIFVWRNIKSRSSYIQKSDKELNFGLTVQLKNNSRIDLKLDGNFEEEVFLKALGKIPELIKLLEGSEIPAGHNFFIFSIDKEEWFKVNIREELQKIASQESKEKK